MVQANTTGSAPMATTSSSTRTELSMLGLARNLIRGNQHQSITSGVIQEFRYYAVPPNQVLAYDTLILQTVVNLFEDAAIQFVKTDQHIGVRSVKKSREAFAFISGTGLDLMIRFYHLDLDANLLRSVFYRKFHLNGRH